MYVCKLKKNKTQIIKYFKALSFTFYIILFILNYFLKSLNE